MTDRREPAPRCRFEELARREERHRRAAAATRPTGGKATASGSADAPPSIGGDR